MAGMNLFAAISMALLHRERTGEGSEVSTSLHAGGLWSNAMLAQGALLDAYVAPRPPRTTAAQRARQPVQDRRRPLDPAHHRARGQAVAGAVQGDRAHRPAGRPALPDDRHRGARHATELAAILDPIFASHPWPEWRKRLRHHEITFGLLGVLRDVPHDEQAVANGAIVPSTVPEMPRTITAPIRLSFAPAPWRPAPARRTASTPTRCWPSSATARPRSPAAHGRRAGLTASPKRRRSGRGCRRRISGRSTRVPGPSRGLPHETFRWLQFCFCVADGGAASAEIAYARFPPVSAASRHRRQGPYFLRTVLLPPFPPHIRRSWTRGRQPGRVVLATAAGCAAPVRESM